MRCARCSTSSTARPLSRIAASASKTTSTMRGASPSDGSSSSSTSGSATSARAIASCCCWPPESAPALPPAELVRRPGRARRRARARRPRRPRAPPGEPEAKVLLDRELGEDAPALRGRARRRLRATSSVRRPTSERPPSVTSPAATGAAPMIACSVDDLPAPFGPIRPTISPRRDLEREAADRAHGAVANLEAPRRRARSLVRPARRSRRGTRRRRRGSRGSRPASPRRASRPWSSTWIRSQTSMISAMLWSISSTPAPCSSRTDRTTAAKSGTSASGSPAAGSSISTKRGSVASARATPSRRSSPCASAPAGDSA